MTVFNREREAVRSKCSPEELAQAIAALDLAGLPPENRLLALRHRVAEVMLATTTDPAERAKPAFSAATSVWSEATRLRRAQSRALQSIRGG